MKADFSRIREDINGFRAKGKSQSTERWFERLTSVERVQAIEAQRKNWEACLLRTNDDNKIYAMNYTVHKYQDRATHSDYYIIEDKQNGTKYYFVY